MKPKWKHIRRQRIEGFKYIKKENFEDDGKPYKATYCKICRKIGDIKFCETEKTDHGT